jgi:hypothetical protein
MADNPVDPPLPAGVADILRQLTALANPQPGSAAYNPDRTVSETALGSFSNAGYKPNGTPDRQIQRHVAVGIADSNRATALSSQPAEAVDYLAELRKITANAQSPPKNDGESDSGNRPMRRTAAQRSSAAPSAIPEWAPALRHVSRIGMANPEFQTAIQKVMAIQAFDRHVMTHVLKCCR